MIQLFLQAPVVTRFMSRICWLRAYASLAPDDGTNLEQTCSRQGLAAHSGQAASASRVPGGGSSLAEAPSPHNNGTTSQTTAGTSDNSLRVNSDIFPNQCYDSDPDPPESDEHQPRPPHVTEARVPL